MNIKKISISDAEWQVMNVVWSDPGMSASEISQKVAKNNKWSYGTTRTYLRRLIKKGALRYEKDRKDMRIYYYFPTISEKEAIESESKSFFQKIVKGNAGTVLASLIKSSNLTNEDITELENILKQRKD